jgi:hypothetical protein
MQNGQAQGRGGTMGNHEDDEMRTNETWWATTSQDEMRWWQDMTTTCQADKMHAKLCEQADTMNAKLCEWCFQRRLNKRRDKTTRQDEKQQRDETND